jgi:hypothetical protein
MEDVVAKYQAGTIVTNEFFTNDECLSQAVW